MLSEPNSGAALASQAIYGTTVDEIERSGDWVRIRTPDDYAGWVHVSALTQTQTPYGVRGTVAMVDSIRAHLYHNDSVIHPPVISLPYETRLEITGGEGRWLQVRLVGAREAWIQSGDLTFRETPFSLAEVVALSNRFVELPYTWGGASSFGYDCSGFTQMLYRRRGINMPRDSHLQANWNGVMVVEKRDLQMADLLFFGDHFDKITHTGMYLGEGYFIHATTHNVPRIQVSELADPHWTNLLVACRRPK